MTPFQSNEGSESMMRGHLTMSTRAIARLLAGLLFTILIVPLNAQATRDCGQYYEVSQEITLSGVVSGVLTRPAPGTIMGSHLLLATVSGTVDISLGRWGLQGEGSLSVTPGQQVEVTGVMKHFANKKVFIARIVKLGDKIYTMRNEHGIPVSPQARERASELGQKGPSL
jgi:hypothetical protein